MVFFSSHLDHFKYLDVWKSAERLVWVIVQGQEVNGRYMTLQKNGGSDLYRTEPPLSLWI